MKRLDECSTKPIYVLGILGVILIAVGDALRRIGAGP